jgi:anaerobic magnesium-protoporphyrin IX monomethyl ester cyclase
LALSLCEEVENMKILLITPPNFSIKMLEEEVSTIKTGHSDFTKSVDWGIALPLGALYLAGAARKAGYRDIELYDLHRQFYICRQTGYFDANNLDDFFNDYVADKVKNGQYDIVGLSCLFNVQETTSVEIIRKLQANSDARIVVGGNWPTNKYQDMVSQNIGDYLVLGEGEDEFVRLIRYIESAGTSADLSGERHIIDVKAGDTQSKASCQVADLDTLAKPAYDLLPFIEEYTEKSMHAGRMGGKSASQLRSAAIMTTRGCPMKCTFCAAHGVHGRRIRTHSIDYIMDHLTELVAKYDANHILFEDDMFNYSKSRTIELCSRIAEAFPNRFTIEFPNGLAVWTLTEQVVSALKSIGLKTITIAIESGNEDVQRDVLKKNLNLGRIKEKVAMLKAADIGVRGFFIIGLVGETIEQMMDTIDFAIDLQLDWAEIKVFTPLFGSEMYSTAVSHGYLMGDTSEHVYGRCAIKTPDFSPEQVERIRYDANIKINFLNNAYLREGKYELAARTFRRLLARFPKHLFAQWALWQALERGGKTDEAQATRKQLATLAKTEENSALLKQFQIHI